MGNWLKKLKEKVIRAQLALEIPLARRKGRSGAGLPRLLFFQR